ncbi:Chitin synthase 8 [Ceratocystis platani]|uniref:chitin synthase n=1 Tax=Ceratocystis fimbriata f. sp. platani TaxID=88771 RepID=A0A0F8DC18_CERFI|nr:Chitin synthase 8 [Ceratocystis platani]
MSAQANGGPSQASLPSLPAHLQSDTQLTAHLASRFYANQPTARLSSHALIALNTYTSSSKGIDSGREGSTQAGAEEIADRAFTRLGYRSENQAVVFLGESGSGKSTLRSHFLSAILNKSSTPLSTKVSLAAYVFDCLTTTKTATTSTASKAGLFYELQYDTATTTNPVLIGAKLLDHRLERSRITDVPTGERNFHILYYLLAGISDAERSHLGLDSPASAPMRWKYLGHPTQMKVGINDAEGFTLFKNALKRLEFPRSEVAEICQILAAILHIGQLEFQTTSNTSVTADDSGGFSHEGGTTTTTVKNTDTLGIVAAFLGVSPLDLQHTLGYKNKMIGKERVTVMLDPVGARSHANELSRTLYSLLIAYVVENINQRLCASEESIANTVSIVDFPGFAQHPSTASSLDQLLSNAATEALYNVTLNNFFERKAELLESEEVTVAPTSYFDNSDAVKGLLKSGNGLLSILDDQTRRHRTDLQFLESLRKRFEGKNPAIVPGSVTAKLPGSNFLTENTAATFAVKHFAGEVEYSVQGLIEENGEIVSSDLMNMINSTRSEFIARLFGQEVLQTVNHPQERSAVMQASISSKPSRQPSVMSRKGRGRPGLRGKKDESEKDTVKNRGSEQGASGQFLAALENVTRAVNDIGTNAYFVFCIKPNDRRIANQFDSKCVRTQLQTFGIVEISQRLRSADFSLFLPFGEFLGLSDGETMLMGSERERVEFVVDEKRWPSNEIHIGSTGVFLSERCWMEVANLATASAGGHYPAASDNGDHVQPRHDAAAFAASKERLLSGSSSPQYGEKKGYYGDDGRSEAGVSTFGNGDMFKNHETREQMLERNEEKKMDEVEEFRDSASRKRWVMIVYAMTWFVPDFLVRVVGRKPRKDIRVAWREKLAINMIIWFMCAISAFFVVGFPLLICPTQHVYGTAELSSHNGDGNSAYVAIRGFVFDWGKFMPRHYPNVIESRRLLSYAGTDVSGLFPVQVSALCTGINGNIDEHVALSTRTANLTGAANVVGDKDNTYQFHDFRAWTNDSRPDWYYEQMTMLRSRYYKGRVGYTPKTIKRLASSGRQIAYIGDDVFDFTEYNSGGGRTYQTGNGEDVPEDALTQTRFMSDKVLSIFSSAAGGDVGEYWDQISLSATDKANQWTCMKNLFYVGALDSRNSFRCKLSDYMVLAVSIALCVIIGFKFFAALQFGGKNMPENLDKFVMCQIPAYTEDEESLRRAIDSLARTKYDDKRKLLVVVCDGMIIGQGNDKPTPRIVLDILGVPENIDPEALSFESLGEGMKQHNMGKVYSGLYEVQGHIVPFLVLVKVGKPSEVSRPGNRGKRDSQMVIMRFLNRVHYNLPMSPLELEMYHQIRNIIGVNPAFYEFLFQIDADTDVAADSCGRMVAEFQDDTRLIALCGETALTNAKSSIVTMIQVYEYFISHNLAKAFESLFGSVTCLPGCFSMYRIRAADTGKPLFVSKEIIEDYSTIRVDTLHMKNLLHLGEDRYLTTLLIKYHSRFKTKYISAAKAWTIAPDSWAVFLSQRRRWINSTVHNLMELMPMNQLCGFCCFSMRFVVFVDLLSTIIQPVTLAYIVYLIVLISTNSGSLPLTAFIMLAVIYGLQAFIFIVRRKWEMIGWMIMYIFAMPVFTFGLPLYSFWHMDDFNWGNTRVVAGEKGKKIVISDEGKFDPSSIPKKKWEEYQLELWETQTATAKDDARSEVSGYSYATKAQGPMSDYGGGHLGGSTYGLPQYGSRMSLAPSHIDNRNSQYGGSQFFSPEDMVGLPSDDAILAEIREILRTADLMTVTKKGIKQDLERRFGVPLDAKKLYINSVELARENLMANADQATANDLLDLWHQYRNVALTVFAVMLMAIRLYFSSEEREGLIAIPKVLEDKKNKKDKATDVKSTPRETQAEIPFENLPETKPARDKKAGPKRIVGGLRKTTSPSGKTRLARGRKLQPLVFYSSVTTNTERIAGTFLPQLNDVLAALDLGEEASAHVSLLNAEMLDLAQIDFDDYFVAPPAAKEGVELVYLFLLPSYNIDTINDAFLQHLQETHYDFRIDTAALGGLAGYSVFGFGDREGWPDENEGFCFQAKELDRWMAKLTGGKRAYPVGMGDTKTDYEERLAEWLQGLQEVFVVIANTGGLGEGLPGSGDADESDVDDVSADEEEDSEVYADPAAKKASAGDLGDVEDLGKLIKGSTDLAETTDFTNYGTSNKRKKTAAATAAQAVAKEMVPVNSPTYKSLTKQGYAIVGWVVDPPELIFEGVKKNHYQKIKVLKGMAGVRAERYAEALRIRHCALSLVGEPIFYPHINEFLAMLHREHISSFLVCNAQHPDQLAALKAVTQLYVSIDASDRESLRRIDRPLHRDFWERFQRCLDILRAKRNKHRTVFRLTLVKGFNIDDEVDGYAELVSRALPCFIEIKGVTYCGMATSANAGLRMQNVPFYWEVCDFVRALDAKLRDRGLDYGIAAEHAHSCCILLGSGRFRVDGKWHTQIDYDKFFRLVEERGADGDWTPEEYMGAETPEWATWGNGGFDPRDQRVDRKGRPIEAKKEPSG